MNQVIKIGSLMALFFAIFCERVGAQEITQSSDTSLVESSYKENIRRRMEACLGRLSDYQILIVSDDSMTLAAFGLMLNSSERRLRTEAEVRVWTPNATAYEVYGKSKTEADDILAAANKIIASAIPVGRGNCDPMSPRLHLFLRCKNGDVMDWSVAVLNVKKPENEAVIRILKLMVPEKYRSAQGDPWK